METITKRQARVALFEKMKSGYVDFACYAIIILLIYTASSKLMEYKIFAAGLANSAPLKPYSAILAWLIPGIEVFFSILLIIPRSRFYGLLCTTLLMLFFTIYLIYMVSYDGPKACGCGGVIQSMSWTQHIYFNIAFLIIAGTAAFIARSTQFTKPIN